MATAATAEGALAAFRQGLEAHDAEALLDAYAEDAVVVAYSERNRPSSAERLEGRAAIEGWIRDFMSRNLTHTIGDEVVAGERFACTETCDYPTGEQVIGVYVCDVREGKIVRQVGAEAWDE
jgi:ketosteroid isomerase-like protein